ncbi:MAG: hypothetical protein DCC52_13205 [Chloroflexi bacterium]|nr:MAG: hypothetical protein DCC52_13205 [Chloroflexota bacterium]
MSVIVSVLSGGLVLLSYVRTQQEAVAGNLHAVAQGAANQVSDFSKINSARSRRCPPCRI